MENSVVIVTGASEGIGKATALQLLKDGATVIFACRDQTKTNSLILQIKNKEERARAVFMKLELSDFGSIKDFVQEFKNKYQKLDILINNAACALGEFTKTSSGLEKTLMVNTLAPMILTQEFIPLLNLSNGKVINVSAKAYDFNEFDFKKISEAKAETYDFNQNNYSGIRQYILSKIGNIYFTQYLKDKIVLNNWNVRTASLHPGVIPTELAKDYKLVRVITWPFFWFFTKDALMGSQTTLHLCYAEDKDFENGEYYSDCKVKALSPQALDVNHRNAYISLARDLINHYGQKYSIRFNL